MKKILLLVLMVCFGGILHAQNPTLIYWEKGIVNSNGSNHTGKIILGIDSTGANSGDVLTWNGSTWAPAASSGGGGSNVVSVGTAPIVVNTANGTNSITFLGSTVFNAGGATNLQGSSLVGSIADARLSANVTLLGQLIQLGTESDLSGTLLTNLNAASMYGTISDSRLSANVSLFGSLVQLGTESDLSGTLLTNLNAASMYGTISDSRLSANVSLFGSLVNLGTESDLSGTLLTNLNVASAYGNLSVNRLNGGSGATSSTFWRGDGSWATAAGGAQTNAANNWTDENKFITANVGFEPHGMTVSNSTTTGVGGFSGRGTTLSTMILLANGHYVEQSLSTAGTSTLTYDGFQALAATSQAMAVGGGMSTLSAGGATTVVSIGTASGAAVTHNAQAVAIPTLINWGSGQWIIPSTGIITNSGTGIYTAGSLKADGGGTFTGANPSSIASGTNNNLNITANLGLGVISNQALTVVCSSNLFVSGAQTTPWGTVVSQYSTNVLADFPSILAAAFSDLAYNVPTTVTTNMTVKVAHPFNENGSLIVDGIITNNGVVILRARNVGGIAVDQGNLQYKFEITVSP